MTDQSNPPPGLKDRANDPAFLFKELNSRIRLCSTPDAQQRITAHVRAVTQHNNLVAFINNGSTPAEKAEVLKVCLRAVLKNDFSELKGEVPSGQAVAPAEPSAPPPVAVVAPDVAKAFGMEAMPETLVKITVTPAAVNDKAAAMAALLTQLMAPGEPANATLDTHEVRGIIKQEIAELAESMICPLRDDVSALTSSLRQIVRDEIRLEMLRIIQCAQLADKESV